MIRFSWSWPLRKGTPIIALELYLVNKNQLIATKQYHRSSILLVICLMKSQIRTLSFMIMTRYESTTSFAQFNLSFSRLPFNHNSLLVETHEIHKKVCCFTHHQKITYFFSTLNSMNSPSVYSIPSSPPNLEFPDFISLSPRCHSRCHHRKKIP